VIAYRAANSGDAASIGALHAESWRRIYRGCFRDEYLDGDVFAERRAAWSEQLGRPAPHQYVYVACAGAELVGFVAAFGAHDAEWGSFVDNLHVDARVHGRGIGSALLREAGAWLASEFPDRGVYLFVWERNPARGFYERLGARDAGVVELDNPGGGSAGYVRYVWQRARDLVRAAP
jgi:GNAT superfamily N-acetyltransferase